ncbi:MAG: hypothetical protein HN712_07930 [Gemmatimonadetes bacterium]|jgi:hypothetical protein|nr:hypothetical protein [Gemmatimonadota bacterium]MBT6146770.1 hypothetical protein [Gemmatimonadota bacterium]MBT7860227.1 hypothetical protein [Gemmatimonadota bacterium]
MLVKILGGVLLTVGVLLAAKMLFGVLAAVASVAFVGVLIWAGWRLISRA